MTNKQQEKPSALQNMKLLLFFFFLLVIFVLLGTNPDPKYGDLEYICEP